MGEDTHPFYVYLASALGPSGRRRAQLNFIVRDAIHKADDGALAGMELRLRRGEFVPHHEELPHPPATKRAGLSAL